MDEQELDKLISQSINTQRPQFDTAGWKEKYPAEFRMLKSRVGRGGASKSNVWRTIIASRITKPAAAAIIVMAVLVTTFLDRPARPAYTLEQTIAANQDVQHVHFLSLFMNTSGIWEMEEVWAKFGEDGDLVNIRVDKGPKRGLVAVLYTEQVLKHWLPAQNRFTIKHIYDDGVQSTEERIRIDPQFAVELLHDLEANGRISIETEDPQRQGEPIRVVATQTGQFVESKPVGRVHERHVLLVDPETKLVREYQLFKLLDGQYQPRVRKIFLDYNRAIEPEMFDLRPPEGAVVLDLTPSIDLPQGKMADAQAAREVVRRYIEALLAKDYETAAKLHNERSADHLAEWVERDLGIKYLWVITIGEPVPRPEWGPRAFGVPFAYVIEDSRGRREIAGPWGGLEWTLEAEANLDLYELQQAVVQPAVEQPDRWVIAGGM